MYCVRWKVGRITVALYSHRKFPAVEPHENMQQFIVDRDCGADIDIHVREEACPQPDACDLLFDSGSIWRVYRWNKGILYTFRTPDASDDFGRALAFELDSSEAILFLPPSDLNTHQGYALSYPLVELLFQYHAARIGAMVVHACGIELHGRTILFCGESGAGKTTLAHLWRRYRHQNDILSDDRILVQNINGTSFGFGTPWHGEGIYASPKGFPVAAVFFIRHGNEVSIDPLSPTSAATELLARSFYPPWEAEAIQNIIQTSARICNQSSCSILSFTPDYSVIEAVESILEIYSSQ